MASRLILHEELCKVLGSNRCYFQPPESVKLRYPCIIYASVNTDTIYADDSTYAANKLYEVTVIDEDPDSEIPDRILHHFRRIRSDRDYSADNLHHYVFKLYY